MTEALALGVSRELLEAPHLRGPHRGVRVPVHLGDAVEVQARAALLALPPGSAITGRTAAGHCPTPSCVTGRTHRRWPRLTLHVGRRGVQRARPVCACARPGVDSAMETRSRLLVTSRGIPEPTCGFDVIENEEWLGVVRTAGNGSRTSLVAAFWRPRDGSSSPSPPGHCATAD